MNRKYIIEALLNIGYKKNGIDSIMCGRRRPKIEAQYKMKDKFNIPLEAWRDIKSFMSKLSQETAN